MSKLRELQEEHGTQIASISSSEQDSLAKIGRKRDKEIARATRGITKMYEQDVKRTNDNANAERGQENEHYTSAASGVLFDSLRQDYEVMQQRSEGADRREYLGTLTDDERKNAEDVYADLRGAKSDEAREMAKKMIGRMPEKIRNAVDILSADSGGSRDITSYIAISNSACYLIAPIDGQANRSLAKSLEDKLTDIFTYNGGEIMLGIECAAMRDGTVNALTQKARFATDINEQNGFVVYEIFPADNHDSEKIARALTEKLNQLQPKSFERVGLVHKVEELDMPVAEYFMKNAVQGKPSIEQGYVSVEEAARILGKTGDYGLRATKQLATKKILKMNGEGMIEMQSILAYSQGKKAIAIPQYDSPTAELRDETDKEVKGRILERLSQYGDNLTIGEYREVMGLSWAGAKKQITEITGAVQDESKRWAIPQRGIAAYLGSHYFSGKRWYPK